MKKILVLSVLMVLCATVSNAMIICDSIECKGCPSEQEELSGDDDGWIALGQVTLYAYSDNGREKCSLNSPRVQCPLYAKEFLNGMVRYRVLIDVYSKTNCYRNGPRYVYFAVSASVCDNGRVIGTGYIDKGYECAEFQGTFYLYL